MLIVQVSLDHKRWKSRPNTLTSSSLDQHSARCVVSRADINAAASLERVIRLSAVVGVKELFEPLNELEIVLETALHQLVHWNYLQHHPALCDYVPAN